MSEEISRIAAVTCPTCHSCVAATCDSCWKCGRNLSATPMKQPYEEKAIVRAIVDGALTKEGESYLQSRLKIWKVRTAVQESESLKGISKIRRRHEI